MAQKTLTVGVLCLLLLIMCMGAYLVGFASHWLGYHTDQVQEILATFFHPTAQEPSQFEVFWEAWEHAEEDFYGELPDVLTPASLAAQRPRMPALEL